MPTLTIGRNSILHPSTEGAGPNLAPTLRMFGSADARVDTAPVINKGFYSMHLPIQHVRRTVIGWPGPLVRLGIIAVLASLLGSSMWIIHLSTQPGDQIIVTNGSDRWATDQNATAARIAFDAPETLQIAVDPAFTAYYQAHDGARLLGAPITPGFPIAQGWIQFFTSNALLLPGAQRAAANASQADKHIESLMQDGLKDRQTGIILLPLLQTLLTIGSRAFVGSGGLTYIDLRNATNPNLMTPAPAASALQPNTTRNIPNHDIFIQEGTQGGRQVGHVIPAALWSFMNRHDVSPDGWQADFGAPLTEAIPFVTVQYGVSHRMLVQAFWRGALVMDRDVKDASGQPLIQPLDTGVAYLQTLVPPTPTPAAHTTIWSSSDLDMLDAPATGDATLHIAQGFPLRLTGKAQWNAGTLWYQAQWKTAKSAGVGWVPANAATFTAPTTPSDAAWAPATGDSLTSAGKTISWASFNLLSPTLAQYLKGLGGQTGVVVYDLTRQRYYTDQLNNQYLTGNSIKVPIMLAFLSMTEQQHRQPTDEEINELTTMIRGSDDGNDNDDDIYNEIGRALGLKEYLEHIGISGLEPENDDLVYSMTKPLAMVQLLALLDEGKILTPQDRALALTLLENNGGDQQIGVGDTRPQGAAVAMKDGWLIGTDDLWAMNSSGIVTTGGETYVIAVYSAHLPTLEAGQAIARYVCKEVASLLPQQREA